MEETNEDHKNYKALLKKYNLADLEVGQMFGYHNPSSWRSSSAKRRIEKGALSLIEFAEGKIKDKI